MFLFISGEKCSAQTGFYQNLGAMRASKTFLFLAGLLTISNGLPNSFQCSRYCKEETNTFGYEPGQVYTYNYEGDVRSLINATKNDAVADESGIKFKCSVDIHVISTCEYAMQISRVFMEEYHVKNTVVEEYPATEKFQELRAQIESTPLHFSYHEGKISTICPDGDEANEILAIKKGILSVFQNSMQDLKKDSLVYETDVTGTCETLYKVISSENGETIVEKTKNLDACTHRMSQYLSWQSVSYSNSQAKSLPLLRSTLSCLQIYNEDDLLKSSNCEEKHVFSPFSNGDNGALSVIRQKMILQSFKESKNYQLKRPTNVKRSSLAYEPNPEERVEVDTTNVLKIFKELESKTSDGVETDVPALFSRLVFYFQNMNEKILLGIFNKISHKQKKFYIDAISLLTTTSGIEVMKNLYQSKLVSKKQMDSWIMSLNFMKNPNLDTISAVKPLMKMNTTKQNTILAVSNIIYRYCKTDPNCISKPAIAETIREIELPLENNCVPSRVTDSNDILLSLKGVGNAGVATSLALLHRCYSNQDSPIELRLAAIAAHRRISCTRNFNLDDFKRYFANPRENTEIRIASYLATMHCASYAVFAQVKDVLIKEETNQVGSFVWTHITNLQESSVKWKQGIKKLLENEFLRNKFNTDMRKYSRNYEASAFSDSIGAGGSVESNIIFTSESYLPRSAMLNFTLDLFGETINVFEVGARIQGFEDIVENIFGPEGYFSDKSIKSFLENARDAHSKNNEEIQQLGQDFRSQNVLKKDPAGLLYAKVFGNEFSYTHFSNLQELIGDPIPTDSAVDILLKLFKENDIEYVKSFLFLDSSYKVPTILGFPLELVANGTSTLGLTVRGKVDLKNLWAYKVSLNGKIYPSASVQIIGTMSVNGLVAKTGVQYVGSLNSNTYIDGHALIDAGKVVDVKLNVPKKQMDILSVSSEVLIIHNDKVFNIQNASDNVEDTESCTQELFNKITGLQLCHNLQYVNASQTQTAPHFPLTGSFKYALNIKKTDFFDSYQLYLQTQMEEQRYKPLYSMSLYIDTPNSLVDRKIKASYHLNLENLSLKAKLESPFTSFEINSSLGNEMNKYSFQLETSYNNNELVSLQSSFNKNFAGETFSYDSQAKLNYRRKQVAEITGSLNYLKRGQYAANLQLEGITTEPIRIVGDLLHDPKFMTLQTTLSSSGFKGNMKSEISILSNFLKVSSNFNYTINSGRNENLSLLVMIQKVRNAPLLEDKLTVKFESTQHPIYNLYIDLHNQRKSWFYENHGRVTFFETTWETNQMFKILKDKYTTDVDIHAELTCDERDINYKAMAVYNKSKTHLTAHVLMQLTLDERVETLVNYKNKDPTETLDLHFCYPKQSCWNFFGSLKKKNAEYYIIEFDGYTSSYGYEKRVISIAGDYTNSSMDIIYDHKINCTVDFPDMRDHLSTPWIITASLQKSKDLFISFLQIKSRNKLYAGHMNWMKDTLSVSIQSNDKQLFVLNGVMNEEQWMVLLVLNIYQHIELDAVLLLPFEKFDMKFYWDKHREESDKFSLRMIRNSYKGVYRMNVEYPNQQIIAAFVLLPTQVTMNVTWGLEVSKQIYLKVGNKVYDVGGLWYGELETPFRYLKKQEFALKYIMLPTSFEVQSDIAWRSQSIKLLMSGSRSTENLTAVFQLNTTLPEISKIGADLTHYRPFDNNFETVARFLYNEHQIHAKSSWKLEGEQILSDFLVESPSDTIQPIGGFLGVNTIDRNSLLFEFRWQGKSVNLACKFKPDTSTIMVNTPFEGFENTTFEYTVKAYANSVSLAVTFDLLKQYNNIDLKWSNLNESMVFFMDITSPVTGYYSLYFTHSTISGILKESFTIKGHEYKDLVLVKLEGKIISILEVNIATNLQLLEHKASLEITIEKDPILSTIKASWNDFKIQTLLFLSYESQQIDSFIWSVNATNNNVPIADPDNCMIYVRYQHSVDKYVTYVQLPKGYILENTLVMATNYELVNNVFNLSTPEVSANLNYKHQTATNIFTQELITTVDGKLLNYSLIFDSSTRKMGVRLDMPYHLKNSNRRVILESSGKILDYESNINVIINKSEEPQINVVAYTNFNIPLNEIGIMVSTGDSSLSATGSANFGETFSSISLLSKTTGPYFNPVMNAELTSNYTYEGYKKSFKINALFNRKNYDFEGTVMTGPTFSVQALAKKDYKYAKLEVLFNSLRGNAMLGYNLGGSFKKIRFIYMVNNESDLKSFMALSSNLEYVPKCRLNTTYSFKDNKMSVHLVFNEHSVTTNGSYTLKKGSNNTLFSAKLLGNLFILYKHEHSEKVNLDIKLTSTLETNRTSGKLLLAVDTNLQRFKNMELNAEYVENKGYEAWAAYKHNNDLYRVDLNNFISNDVFEISSRIETPKLGLVRFEMNTLKKYTEYTTQIILNVNKKLYSADVITSYVNNFDTATRFQINMPTERYSGNFEIKFGDRSKLINLTLALPDDVFNLLTFDWDMDESPQITSHLQIDYIKLVPQKIIVEYDFDSPNKTFTVTNFIDSKLTYNLSGEINSKELNIRLGNTDKKDFIVIGGTHKFNTLRDFSLSYVIFKNGTKMKIDVLNYFGNTYQTKLDISSYIRGWSRITLETKLDQDKIRISFNIRNHRMSLVAKKLSAKSGEILSITFQGETLLEILSAAGQVTLTTSTRFGKYRFFIQYNQNPGIYIFTILKNRENLISLMLQNLSTNTEFDFKGKLIAPELIPNYSNLSLQLHAERDLSKSAHFRIFNSLNELFEIKWFTKRNPGEYTGYFKFNSEIEMLQNIEIYTIVSFAEDTVFTTKFTLTDEYYALLVLPNKNQETRVSIKYPCIDYKTCEFFFNVNPRYLNFHWTSPFEKWRNMSLISNLQLEPNLLTGELRSRKGEEFFDLKFHVNKLEEFLDAGMLLSTNTGYLIDLASVSGKYVYYRSLDLDYETKFNKGVVKALLGEDSFRINVINDDKQICNITFMETNYDEGAFFGVTLNNVNIVNVSRGKVNNRSLSQFLKANSDFILQFDGYIYYDFSSLDHQMIGGHFISNETYVLDEMALNATLDFHSQFQLGRAALSYRSKDINDTNEAFWFLNLSYPNTDLSVNFTRNEHVVEVRMIHDVDNSSINSSFNITCGHRQLGLVMKGESKEQQLNGLFNLITPIPSLSEINVNALIKRTSRQYDLYNYITWPDNFVNLEATAISTINSKKLDVQLTSSFTAKTKALVEYKKIGKKIDFVFESMALDELIQLKSEIIPWTQLNTNLSTSFEGFTTCNLTSSINQKDINIRATKDNLTINMNGIFAGNSGSYEIDMEVNYPNGEQDVAKAYLKLRNSNFNLTLKFKNDGGFRLDAGLDNNIYNLYIHSPYQFARDVNLKGIYNNDVNIYNLESDGHWNDLIINFSGTLNTLNPEKVVLKLSGNAGENYEGKMNFTCNMNKLQFVEFVAFFPSRKYNTYMKFEQENNEASFLLKSPFDVFSSLNAKSVVKKYEKIDILVSGNIMGKQFTISNTGIMNSTDVRGRIFVDIPDQLIQMEIQANKLSGFINLNQNNKSSWNKMTINYTNDWGKFTSNYIMSGRWNVARSLVMLYKDGPNVEYGLIIDDNEILEKILIVGKNVSTEFVVKIPYFGVNNAGFYLKKYSVSDNYNTGIYYNEFYAKGLFKFNNPSVESEIDTFLPFLGLFNATALYTNNDDKFEFTTMLKPGSANISTKIFVKKDSSHTILSLGELFKLELERGDRLKFFILIQTIMHLNVLDMQVSDNLFFLKAVTPILEKHDVEIILNKFHESRYKQFKLYYKENGIQKYFAIFTFENTRADHFAIKADLESTEAKLITFEANLSYLDYIESFVIFKAFGVEHKGNVTLNLNQPYVGKLDLISPRIKNNRFIVEIEITSIQTMTFFVSSGDQSLGNYILFQSAYQGKSMAMNVDAPKFNYLKLFKINLLWDFDDDNVSRNNLKIESDVLGDIIIQADFKLLDDLLDIETLLEIPFLENLETFYGKIYIPKEFRPKLIFILPQGRTYSLHFNHSINSDVIFIDGGFTCDTQILNVFFNLSQQEREIEAKLTIPNESYRYFALLIKKEIYMANINDNEYLLSYNYKNDEAHKLLDVLLRTPFKKFEKSSFNLEYKTGTETLMKLSFFHPTLEKEAQFLLTYESLMSFELTYNIHLPLKINDFDFVDVVILNKLNPKPSERVYTLECMAATNNYSASLNLEAVDNIGHREFVFETEINENNLAVVFQLLGNSLTDFNVSTSIKSPLELLDNLMFQLISNTKFAKLTHYDELTLVYNDDSIIASNLNLAENWLELSVDNIWQPFSLEYKFTRISRLDVFAKLIWDLRNPKESQIGGYLYLGHDLSTGLYLPNNTITFDALSKNEINNETHCLKASWNEHDVAISGSMVKDTQAEFTKINMVYYIQLPFRKFQLFHNVSQNKLRNVNSTINFIWGEDPASRLIFKNEIHPGKLVSILTTAPLEHDLILTIDMSKFKQLPSIVRAQFEYSNITDKRIQFEIFYNKRTDSAFATQRNFIFKHPASKIDYELYFNSLRTPQFSNGSFVVKYRNFETNTPESIQASVKVDHSKFGVLGEVETNKNSFNFKAASTSTDDSLGFLIRAKVNEKDPLHVECTYYYKQISPSVNFLASYGDSRRYILYAGLPNEREITAKLGHELYGKYSLDSLLTMKLNTSQLLWVKIVWTKELYPHFYKAILEEYNDLRFVIEATGKELIDVINDDLGKEFIKDATKLKQQIIKYVGDEKIKILNDIKNSSISCTESNYICKILRDSKVTEFLKIFFGPLRDYLDVIRETFEKAVGNMLNSFQHSCKIINVQIEKALKDIKNIKNIKIDAKDILKKGISDARKSLKEMEVIAVKLLDDFDKYIGHINAKIEEFFEPFLNLLDDLIAYAEQRLALLQIVILDVLDKIQHYVYNLRETQEMLRVYAAYINWLEEIHLTDLLEPIGDVIEDVLETIINDAKKVTEHYKPYLDALSEAVFGKYDRINQLPPITEFREFVNRLYQKTIWIWHYHNMTESLKSFIQRLSHDIDDMLMFIELDEKSGDFENHFGLTDYVVKPEVGLIEISQPLPFQWDSFNKRPSFQQNRLYQQIQRKLDQFVKIYKRRYDLIDGMGNLLLDLSEPSMAPITNNFAMIIGRSHFVTFNNNYFNFISNCSYLLASDFHMNSFALLINFDEMGLKRSFEILTSGASVEISSDYKVFFDKKEVELPLLYNHITVMKEYGNVIVESTKGIKMVCNDHYDFCTIQLSGWLFGKTAGLLGTLDNEQSSDIALSNGTRVRSIPDFTNSWKLQKQCTSTTIKKKEVQHGSLLVKGILSSLCNVYFSDSNSPLHECFDKVDPEPFETMCYEDMKAEDEVTGCSIIAAYRARCKKANVHLDIPELCLHCSNDIGTHEKIFDGHNPKSLDIVFITQLNCFNGDYNISLPNKLSNSLIGKGYTNNRFASIGFGGKTVTKPHMYTSGNDFWTTSDKLNIRYKYNYARWNSLQFKAVDAVKYASNMNFRPGVPKLFILSQCDVTTEMDNAPEIYNMLGEKDITLHVLIPKPFGNSSDEIGIDGNNNVCSKIQTGTSADEIIGRLDDVYSGLALSTNGTIFDFGAVTEDEEVSSMWTTYVTRNVKRSPCQKCKCLSDSNGVGRIECSRCLTPAVKQFLNEYEANNKMRFREFGDAD